MVEIVKQLNINRHPRDCSDYSLVSAGNMKLTHDKHSLTNEEGIENNSVIKTAIGNSTIVGIIPTSTELVIFTNTNKIYRYNERTNTCTLVNSKWTWSGGKIKGTYTTNVNNDLIIAVAEYDKHDKYNTSFTGNPKYNGDVPLKIINLDDSDDIFNAGNLAYAACPIVPYAIAKSFDYKNGYSYKGYYEFYIRYKISNNNYTQWYLINGKPLVDVTSLKQIMSYVVTDRFNEVIRTKTRLTKYSSVSNGHYDFVSEDKDFCSVTLEVNLDFIKNAGCPNYSEYQLAYVVTSKTYNKCYRTDDISISETSYIVNPKTEIEQSSDELVLDYYNYYNVRQITNYKNRVYIADYKEHSLNPKNMSAYLSGITLGCKEVDAITGSDEGGGETTTYWRGTINYAGGNAQVENPTAHVQLVEATIDSVDYLGYPCQNIASSYTELVIHTNNGDITTRTSMAYILFDKSHLLASGDGYAVIVGQNASYNRLGTYSGSGIEIVNNVNYITVTGYQTEGGTDQQFSINAFQGNFEELVGVIDPNTGGPIPTATGEATATQPKDLLNNYLIPDENYDFYINFVDIFGHISTGMKLDPDVVDTDNNFYHNVNNNGDKYFTTKIPASGLKGYRFTIESANALSGDYIAAFISYKKFEKKNKLTGISYGGTRFANGVINYEDRVDIGVDSAKKLYAANPTDWHNLLYNTYKALAGDEVQYRKYKSYFIEKGLNPYSGITRNIIPEIKVANSATADNIGRESYIRIANLKETDSYKPSDIAGVNLVTLFNDNLNPYANSDRELIPTACIITNDEVYDNNTGYNGFLAFDSVIVYYDGGFVLNGTEGNIYNALGNQVISNDILLYPEGTAAVQVGDTKTNTNSHPYVCYIFAYFWDYPLHVRVFNNAPRVTMAVPDEEVTDADEGQVKHVVQTIVEPKDSIDLFKYPHPNKSDVGSFKTLISYNEEALDVTEYGKTVRRSDVLADETENIAWRRFPVEGYKNITENKGIITNLLGLGYYFFVHTEHSLFMFDIDAAIHTENQDIKMYQPDVFEVDYKEIFTSEKGYGGLQDDLAWCSGEFGYIFYNNDNHRFYRFDGDKLVDIDTMIVNYLLHNKPTNVRFAVDRLNSRILIKMYDGTDKTISYDYLLNSFVSWHNYSFYQAFNTKVKTYYIYNNLNNVAQYSQKNYGNYVNYVANNFIPLLVSGTQCNCNIDIIVNTEYEALKMLEFISYNCRKENNAYNTAEIQDRNIRLFPFSGNKLRIYNEDCDSLEMNIETTNASFNRLENYKKPYYELAKWNFNYFRDKIPTHPTTNGSDKLRRLFGNYIIFKFTFVNDGNKIEFESLDCKFSLNR